LTFTHLYIIDETFGSHIWEKYGYKFSAANSINWGRLLPQVVHHASGYLDLVKQGEITLGEPIDVCLPTGNFGNILAAFYAKVNYTIEYLLAQLAFLYGFTR
jgi:threonine synthase